MARKGEMSLILEELKQLNSKVDGIKEELQTLNNTVTGIRQDVDKNIEDIANIREELNTYKNRTDSDILQLKTSFNNREQQLRSCTVRIFNFQVSAGESVDNYANLATRVYDRVIQPALAAAVAAGDLARVPPQAAAIEACFRAFSPTEPPAGAAPCSGHLPPVQPLREILRHEEQAGGHIPV